MGTLPNRKHEVFARELAAGAPLEASYLVAGYKSGRSARFNASRLRNTSALKARIEELNVQFAEASGIKTAWLMEQLVKTILYNPARAADDLHEVASRITIDSKGERFTEIDRMAAINLLGKMLGALTDKTELTLRKRLTELTADELEVLERRLASMSMTAVSKPPILDGRPPPQNLDSVLGKQIGEMDLGELEALEKRLAGL